MTGIKLATIVLMLAGVLTPVPRPAWSLPTMDPPASSAAAMFGALNDFFVFHANRSVPDALIPMPGSHDLEARRSHAPGGRAERDVHETRADERGRIEERQGLHDAAPLLALEEDGSAP